MLIGEIILFQRKFDDFGGAASELMLRRLPVPQSQQNVAVRNHVDTHLPIFVIGIFHRLYFIYPLFIFLNIGRDHDPFRFFQISRQRPCHRLIIEAFHIAFRRTRQ